MDKKEIMQHIENAFKQVASMCVSDVNQDKAALAKRELSIAWKLLEKEEKENQFKKKEEEQR